MVLLQKLRVGSPGTESNLHTNYPPHPDYPARDSPSPPKNTDEGPFVDDCEASPDGIGDLVVPSQRETQASISFRTALDLQSKNVPTNTIVLAQASSTAQGTIPKSDLNSQYDSLRGSNIQSHNPPIPPPLSPNDPSEILFRVPPAHNSPVLQPVISTLELLSQNKEHRDVLRARLASMARFLQVYAYQESTKSWTEASKAAAAEVGKGPWLARQLRTWVVAYFRTKELPHARSRRKKVPLIEDEGLREGLRLFLQQNLKGKHPKAQHVVDYTAQPEIMEMLQRTRPIALKTAQRWLKELSYRFEKGNGKRNNGIYVDRHEGEDVVQYRQLTFLPHWFELEQRVVLRDQVGDVLRRPHPPLRPVYFVTHDECIFYARDQRSTRWVHGTQSSQPFNKDDGVSMMVSDFALPEMGWLRSKDGTREARIILKNGKDHGGNFDNRGFLEQVTLAIDIFEEHFPPGPGSPQCGLAFDHASIHKKRAPDALSARHMPKNTKLWPEKPTSSTVRMRPGRFLDGTPQDLYFSAEHPDKEKAGKFKGMEVILRERGIWPAPVNGKELELQAECTGFKCPSGRVDCCARRLLYSQPDFVGQKSAVEELVEGRGHLTIFYPKFHSELNFIEMCWAKAKSECKMLGTPATEEQMEQNVRASLDSVTVDMMRRFAGCATRFIHAYSIGLTGAQAAWANKKYRGHRVLPVSIWKDLKEQEEKLGKEKESSQVASRGHI